MHNEAIKKRAYEIFEAKCMKMVESKFLLAQPCISSVLKCIISSAELYQFFKDIIYNIDLEKELSKATLSKDDNRFKLPDSKRLMVALVTYLLNQFDNNGIDLMEFISYYYNPDTNIGYQVFCKDVILPYVNNVKELFIGGINEEPVQENIEDNINSAVLDEADGIIKNMITVISGDNSLTDIERKDYISLAEGMMIALFNLDRKVIIALWISFKYIMGKNRKLSKLLKSLEKLLRDYMIIDLSI